MTTSCKICDLLDWTPIYQGMIRNGAFGNTIEGEVYRCNGCGIDRLPEEMCIQPEAYETKEYRDILKQGLKLDDFFRHADAIQIHNFSAFWPLDFRGKLIADIGTGGGSFPDHIASLAEEVIVIEPTNIYHSSLEKRRYRLFNYTNEALIEYQNKLDFVFSFQVIEHVLDPIIFIKEALALLKPGGKLIIATPNRNDILMNLLPDDFPEFFYRTVHRWYFDEASLTKCFLKAAGNYANIDSCEFVHTFGLSNTFNWLKYKRPCGHDRIEGINLVADQLWSAYLKSSCQSDTIYLMAIKNK